MARATQPVCINDLEFDALLNESNTLENTVPQYVTDEGFYISDAILQEPEKLDMLLVITELPITWKDRAGHETNDTRLLDSIKKLQDMYYNREPVTVVTFEKTYENMAIESIILSKDEKVTGRTREIPISFQKIMVTKTGVTNINVPNSNGKSGTTKKSTGVPKTQQTNSKNAQVQKAESTQKAKSALKHRYEQKK